jgi:hypothetical protein
MNNCSICWCLRIFLLGILIFKGLNARRLYKSFGVKGVSSIGAVELRCVIQNTGGQLVQFRKPYTDMRRLTTGILSEKCVVVRTS